MPANHPYVAPSPSAMGELERRYAQGRIAPFAPSATTEIAAPVDVVWSILVDFDSYETWNRFTPAIRTTGMLGSTVDMTVCFPGAKPMRQVEVLNVLEPPQRLAWGTFMGTPAVLVANRYQVLEPIGASRTRYTTIDFLSGLIAPLVKLFYAEQMRRGFTLAAEGLKAHAESRAG